MNTLKINGVSKVIQGTTVLKNINLLLEGGNIYAVQGENGSGKTMLFRVISGLSMPTTGNVYYNGIDLYANHKEVFKIGIIIENAALYPQFTGMQNLLYLAQLNNIIGKKGVMEALKRVGLDPMDARPVRKYSLGMKQRLLIAQAIMEKPDFIFLDEPTNAIDKAGVNLVYDIIKQEAERGAVVLLASHVDKDISELVDLSYQMQEGELVDENQEK